MIKKVSKSLIIIAICIMAFACFLIPNNEQTIQTEQFTVSNNLYSNNAVATSDSGFEIDNYSAKIDCSEGRKAKVTEQITVIYHEYRHGIYRDLNMANGEDYSKISVQGAEFSLEKNYDYIRLIIGSADRYENMEVPIQYTISYHVVMPKFEDSKDSLLYNVVPYGFTTSINSFDVDMTLPTSTILGLQVHSGYMGIEGNPYSEYELKGNHLLIRNKEGMQLNSESGVGVRIDFPSGTLAKVVNLEPLYIFLVGAVILIAAIVVLFVFGRDDKIVEVVRFDPPYNMSPTDVGYLIDGKIDNEDITNLFFYWAKLGAMEIHEEDNNIVFVKTGELPDTCKPYEKSLFASLFLTGKIVNPNNFNSTFIDKVVSCKSSIKKEFAGKIYTKQSKNISKLFMLFAVLFVMIVSTLSDYIKYGAMDLSIGFLGIIIGFVVLGYYSMGKVLMEHIFKIHQKNKRIMYFIGYGLLGVVIAVAGMFLLSFMQKFTLIKSFCMIICPILTCWIAPYICKRTDEYNEILGEILGFRNFILVAEKDRLEALVKDNPEYYYDILPYANVLGVTDILQDKFKDIPLEMPYWYRSNNITLFDIYMMNNISRTLNGAVVSQVASATAKGVGNSVSKFGGGSSGGGFSGGGFGGGGGGSW